MIVYKEDVDSNIDPIPVRKGCWGGPCACIGSCREIVGNIGREAYLEFMKNYISPDDWIKQNMVTFIPKKPDYRNKKYSIQLRTYSNIRTKLAEKKIGFSWGRKGSFEIIGINNLSEFMVRYKSIDKDASLVVYPDLDSEEQKMIYEYQNSNNI